MLEQFKLLKSETQPLTLELAQQFRELEPSPTERALNPARLKYLTEKAEAGLLVSPSWATARLGGRLLRVNGQHSSTVLCSLNGSFPEGLQVHIDSYQVDDEDGLALLFRQFDDRKSSRSPADVAGAYQGLELALRDLPRPTAKLGVDGIAWWRRNAEGLPVSSSDGVYELFSETALHPFLTWLGEIFTIKTPELRRPSIVGAMYASFIASESNARTFWSEVARGGVEFDDGHPTTVLDAWLKALREAKHDDGKIKPANFYQGCIYAWNAYREGKTLAKIKYDTAKGLLKAAE